MKLNIEVDTHIDWLSLSYYEFKTPAEIIPEAYHHFKVKEPCKPFPHYDEAWRLECGATLHLSYDSKQGGRMDIPGDALAWLRAEGWKDDYLLKVLAETPKKRRTTRLDYALNIHNAGSVRHTVNHWRAHQIKTTFTSAPSGWQDYGKRAGQTVYFGSPKSDKFVRIYDKGAEMKMLNEAWLRVELQTRKEYAQALVIDASRSSMLEAGRTHLTASLDFPKLRWWGILTEGDTVNKTQVLRKRSKWQEWMDGQVFESILKHVKNIDDGKFLEEWLAKVAIAVAAAETKPSDINGTIDI